MNAARKNIERKVTAGQIKKIHTVKSILMKKGIMSEDDHRSALAGYGVESSKDLSYFQAHNYMESLEKLIPETERLTHKNGTAGTQSRPTRRKRYEGKGERGRQRHLTPLQAERIRILEDLLGWNSVSVQRFIYKQIGKLKGVEMLMNYEAGKVIVGMQRVLAFNTKVEYGKLNNCINGRLKEFVTESKVTNK